MMSFFSYSIFDARMGFRLAVESFNSPILLPTGSNLFHRIKETEMEGYMQNEQRFIAAISFTTPYQKGLSCEKPKYVTKEEGFTLTLLSKHQEAISKSNSFVLFVGEPDTDKPLLQHRAERMNSAIMLSSVIHGLGILSANKPPKDYINTGILYEIGKYINIDIDFAHIGSGVNILPFNDKPYSFPGVYGSCTSLFEIDIFSKTIFELYNLDIQLDDKFYTILDILNSSFHQSSPWANYILCISAVELMCEIKKEDEKLQDAIQELIDYSMASFDSDVSELMKNKLNECRKKSISKICREKITQYLGKDRAEEWNTLYGIRSRIAHGSYYGKKVSINVDKAYCLAKDLLFEQIIEKNPHARSLTSRWG